MIENKKEIKGIIGLGNPGPKFSYNRHNIGFLVVDALADKYHGEWQNSELLEYAVIDINGKSIYLVKPQTFMNASGKISSWLKKKGISEENVIVVHDDLERPFGKVTLKIGGSAQGHNGVKSLIELLGINFYRIRCGIGRPEKKSDVSDYVLSNFVEGEPNVEEMIQAAIRQIELLMEDFSV
ncbi:TPA: aminoacyl-tRNA hydrolase [Candidatus Dependentiae bacterium]|nr:MAG: Peptidyl-tRNA hydrolase [candidate division TM6 bacterium GW2011_GWF2_36_131]KKQ03725.1 MAG: Peptidyl-tRNA hydrolase [candidate division TM6 bacterium GW2011_GWE2_36_25]KKQ20039.1 MAG: Peptidyl-tRNA hydrolase [candidate division TM6 bacterium GW2011_GWA2_36_9]HBR70492.1 aminoacyl-tRNA hydrolase [Candidatus Dependentiae bacterium]HCU00792.1 aminoacyl-tRNA hydrolase [Candidatus Dependentiae bacterium]